MPIYSSCARRIKGEFSPLSGSARICQPSLTRNLYLSGYCGPTLILSRTATSYWSLNASEKGKVSKPPFFGKFFYLTTAVLPRPVYIPNFRRNRSAEYLLSKIHECAVLVLIAKQGEIPRSAGTTIIKLLLLFVETKF